MRLKNLFILLLMILAAGSLTQCEKGPGAGMGGPDPTSDRPDWSGGNTVENPHNKKDQGGTTGGSGGDYGDLYVLYRDINGVPEMTGRDADENGVVEEDEYFVQPLDVDGNVIILDQFGEVPPDATPVPVDFGRLDIVRSPQSVLDQAMGEALKVINAGEKFSLDFCGRITIWNTVEGILTITKTIDSPRESMALYQEIMNHGFDDKLAKLKGTGIDPLMLAASCIAAGSDKTGTINIDEVVYINGFIDCLGCNPILNEHEYDFDNNNKYYFNFGDCDCHSEFQYNRDIYKDRMLKIITLNPDGTWTEETVSVLQAMEDRGLFMFKWEGPFTHVKGFAAAADDAVQVLEFVHGNSNIEFLPVTPI